MGCIAMNQFTRSDLRLPSTTVRSEVSMFYLTAPAVPGRVPSVLRASFSP